MLGASGRSRMYCRLRRNGLVTNAVIVSEFCSWFVRLVVLAVGGVHRQEFHSIGSSTLLLAMLLISCGVEQNDLVPFTEGNGYIEGED